MRDNVLRRVLRVVVVASLAAACAGSGAWAESKPAKPAAANTPADPNTDNFCLFEGTDGKPGFQCDVKGRYPLGTPCICPGKPSIGKITHR